MHPDQLGALEAVADFGTFEAAARRLGVSTSAVSQRIRALESALGRVLVRRGSPCAPTPDGEVVLRYARQQALLAAEMAAELDLDAPAGSRPAQATGAGEPVELAVAVNADSLATWFTAVLREAAGWSCRLRLVVADEGRTAELLRSGRVMCAVSSSGTRVAGCRAERLGVISYVPVVAPGLLADGATAASLPVVRFDADDDTAHITRPERSSSAVRPSSATTRRRRQLHPAASRRTAVNQVARESALTATASSTGCPSPEASAASAGRTPAGASRSSSAAISAARSAC